MGHYLCDFICLDCGKLRCECELPVVNEKNARNEIDEGWLRFFQEKMKGDKNE